MPKGMIKESRLVKKKRTTRGKGKKDRVEWALVSKTNPKKILRWFGPRKPSKKRVAKEERRVHSFASDDLVVKKLIVLANELDSRGLIKEADVVDQLIIKAHFEPASNRKRKRLDRIGRLITYSLRHRPEELDITLDEQGWVEIDVLLEALHNKDKEITREELEYLIATSDKQRFAVDESGEKIRANQGHTVDVNLGYESQVPPEYLYHGTNEESVKDIMETGVQRMKRHAVHLSEDLGTAIKVGERRGRVLILRIQSGKMHEDGYVFQLSDNNVWLTDNIPIQYIEISSDA